MIAEFVAAIETLVEGVTPDVAPGLPFRLADKRAPLDRLPVAGATHRTFQVVPRPPSELGVGIGSCRTSFVPVDIVVRYLVDDQSLLWHEVQVMAVSDQQVLISNLMSPSTGWSGAILGPAVFEDASDLEESPHVAGVYTATLTIIAEVHTGS